MNNRFKWLAAASGVALIAMAMAPWTFSGTSLRREIARQVGDTTGLIANARGRAVFALLPRPRIKIENVEIHDRAGKFSVEAEMLRGDLRILPMFLGRLELASASLMAPRINLDLDSNPFGQEGAIARASRAKPASPEATLADRTRLGVISIQGATVRLRSPARGLDTTLHDLDLTVDWRGLNTAAGAKSRFQWRGDPVQAAIWFANPTDLLRGEKSAVIVRVESPALSLALNGSLTNQAGLNYQGNITAAAAAPRDLARTIGYELPLPGPLHDLSISGAARANSHGIVLSDLRLSLDGNNYEGALALADDAGRPSFSGTLATDLLDVSPLLTNLPTISSDDGRWSHDPLPLADLTGTDVDLRVSATLARLGRLQARDAGMSIIVGNGKAELSLAEAKAFGGRIKGRVNAELSPEGYKLRGSASFDHVDTAALMNETFHSQRLSGEGSGEIELTSQGADVASILRGLHGEARIDVRNGDINGIDLEQALRRIEKRPLSIASEIHGGRTGFESVDMTLGIDSGIASIQSGDAKGPGVAFSVTGSAGIPQRTVGFNIRAWQTGPEPTDKSAGSQLAMDFTGSWDNPALVLDTQSLIERSRAAAPLWGGTPMPDATNPAP